MNVLLTCAGRRNYLLRYFRQALRGTSQVFAADADPLAPAMQEADVAVTAPSFHQPDYVDHLVALCEKHRIRLLFSLNDLELPILACHRDRFSSVGTTPVVSAPDVIATCSDKWATHQVLTRWGLPSPKTFLSLTQAREALVDGEITFPVVVKPRWGTASIGIEYPTDDEELELAYRLTEIRTRRTVIAAMSAEDPERAVLVQQHLPGREHGLDVVNDLDGRYVTTFVKRKLAMRAGETDRAMTIDDEQLQKLGETLGRHLHHIGNLDCDVFVSDGQPFVLEMNPRFGGGYPFSHLAGANLPAALIAWASRQQPDPRWLSVRPNVVAAKYDRLIAVPLGAGHPGELRRPADCHGGCPTSQ
jgi:carbamoyl-phosphate synthase large subunit